MPYIPLKRKGNTSVRHEDGDTIVRYHHTDIVRFNEDRIILDTGGWKTLSTKARMNQVASEFLLDFDVFQKDFNWFVGLPNHKVVPFWREIEFTRKV